ncbi:hypothetical protein BH20CHL1_BH20CHL1_03490 [soil metagenome]
MRRAWLAMAAGLLVLAAVLTGATALGTYYYRHATQAETATVTIISGTNALLRSPGDEDWRYITETTTISEGDEVSTTLGTVLWITLFDGSTIEVSEDTVLRLARTRSSRFLQSTKHVVLRPERGTIYVAMAPHGEYRYSELSVELENASVTMTDGDGRTEVGSFLVEVQRVSANAPIPSTYRWMRAAVLRGAATLQTESGAQRLLSDQQVRVDPSGVIGPVTSAVRELIVDGSFEYGLSNWVEFHDASGDSAAPTRAGSVELVNESLNGTSVVAAELLRAGDDEAPARTGIRQRIGQTLRVYSSVQLTFHIKISAQTPLAGGADLDQFPLVVELNYIDILGEERQWSRRFYALEDQSNPVPIETGSRVDLDTWEYVIFDLRKLSPLPRQITSVVVYASGRSYQTSVTNISLTSGELGQSGQ